jgi:LysR family transcriptional regulator of beta-lactamase
VSLNGVSLNGLRAFEAAARHLNLSRAAEELCVTQAAVSHQVKALEAQLGRALFRRHARGLLLTDEGEALAPVVAQAFERMGAAVAALREGGPAEVLTVGVVGTFALGFLLERLADFRACHPRIELRVQTHNNKVDLAAEGLDLAIRFGDGAWRSVEAELLLAAPLAPLCEPALAAQLHQPEDLARLPLLRSYRQSDWPAWLAAAGATRVVARGPVFDASALMVQAALRGEGVALAPPCMFAAISSDAGRWRLLAHAAGVARADGGHARLCRLAALRMRGVGRRGGRREMNSRAQDGAWRG